MRVVGIDSGRKRVGLALSDASGTLARPWKSVAAGATPAATADVIARLLPDAADPFDEAAAVGAIVVGLPRRLSGEDNDHTQAARDLAAALRTRTQLEVHLQDERLTSREAESRLATREKDWRKRKAAIDAAAAAIILQDFLDARSQAQSGESSRAW